MQVAVRESAAIDGTSHANQSREVRQATRAISSELIGCIRAEIECLEILLAPSNWLRFVDLGGSAPERTGQCDVWKAAQDSGMGICGVVVGLCRVAVQFPYEN